MIAAAAAHADSKNEVRAVTFDEDAGVTRVHVRGVEAPTFTAYKLDRPSRVVIDMPHSKLADVLKGHESAATFTPSTWAVSTIAAQQLDDGTVRVIVTLARPGRYDVKTLGDEVVVMVTARDPAPKTASPEDLARMQAESDRAKQLASQAEHARQTAQQQADAANALARQSRAEADAAKAEAERLRKLAADQGAKADAAQRTVQTSAASGAELARAKDTAAKAQADADTARSAAATAQSEADRTRRAAEQATQAARAEADRAKADAAQARAEMARTQTEAAAQISKSRDEATRAKNDAAKQTAALEQAKTDAAKQAAALEQAKTDAANQRAASQQALAAEHAAAQQAKTDAAKQAASAEQAKQDAAQRAATAEKALAVERAEAEQAKRDAEDARADAQKARAEIERAEIAGRAQVEAARGEVTAAKSDAARARDDANRARSEAAAEKVAAEQARTAAAADKRAAEKLLGDANTKLAALDKKSADAQALEDHARAENAAAQTREDEARLDVAQATHDRDVALAAVKQAQDARDKAAATDRARLAADAKAAEDRLAQAKRATDDAETRRAAAEQAATAAQQDLAKTKTALATVEDQRTQAVAAASDAARKRGDAEAAASDAARRRDEAVSAAKAATKQRSEAELAATDAAQRKNRAEHDRDDAEAQREAALAAARSAQLARDAADKQRAVAETAAQAALAAKQSAEQSLAQLTTRKLDAEHAARDLEARAQAEAKAQADVAAAEARKAGARELDAARADLTKLAADRKHAEDELADRRKAVAMQEAEATRLASAAAQAHDAADREETRRADLAKRRTAEEQELDQLEAKKQALADAQAKAEAQRVKDQVAAKPADKPANGPADKTPVKVAKIGSINFRGNDASSVVDIAVGDGATVTVGEVTPSHIELIVDHAELAPKLERTLDVTKFGSAVKTVSTFRDRRTPDRVRLVAELAQAATPTVDRDGGVVHWHFDGVKHALHTTDVPSPVVGGFGAASTPIAQQSVTQLPPQGSRRHIYHGAPVDIELDDAPMSEALRIIQDVGHINIVVPDTINPKVTVKLSRVPWDEALEVILASHQLWFRKDGNIYRIAPRKELDSEDEAEAARREASLKAEAPRPETVQLNYANADDLRIRLADLLSSKGHIQVDKRTNTLIINDVSGNRAEIAKLAYKLDTQTPEISIEARIVEADSTFSRSFGIQWGGNGNAGAAGGNATGLAFPSTVGVAGGADDTTTNATGVAASPSDFAVNLPATVGTNEGGALGISLGSIGGNFNINLRLSAAEDTGNVRIISSPKITVLNNKLAHISQGTSIPISVVSAAGTNTQFVQADLSLDVTPVVSQRDCAIAMDLNITNDQPDFSQTGARGDPTIQTKTAKTSMLVNDGETAVLGGIYTRNTSLAYNKVPFLGDIPVLGWLFKKRSEIDNRSEILVFITPRIVNRANLPCGAAPGS
ncbi:MAG TPA: type IV pilus secretin PilQ [Kofleriaceae bacterium]|jgi:type IV pilus assembly protein PilQ